MSQYLMFIISQERHYPKYIEVARFVFDILSLQRLLRECFGRFRPSIRWNW